MSITKAKTKLHYDSGAYSILKNIPLDGHITPHFTWDEYSNKRSGEDIISEIWPESLIHAKMYEELRMRWYERKKTGLPCSSWFRTKKFNESVHGSVKSMHLWGCASDSEVGPVSDIDWQWLIEQAKDLGRKYNTIVELGRYDWGFHFGSHVEVWNPYTTDPIYIFDKRTKQ